MIRSLVTALLVLTIYFQINAQGLSTYHDRGYLIRFEPGTPQSTIEAVKDTMNVDEIWVSPLSETRYWELRGDFPYYNSFLNEFILDINEQKEGSSGRANVDEVELNYFSNINPLNTSQGNNQNYCYELVNDNNNDELGLKISILDTGFSGSPYGVFPTSFYNYIDNNSNVHDDNGHGTFIYSIIESTFVANSALNPQTIEWDIRKTHNHNGQAELANIVLALEDAVLDGADIINMSTSYYNSGNLLDQEIIVHVIELIENNNVLIVASAGNNGIDLDKNASLNCFPSEFSTYNLLTVGSYNCEEDVLSAFSNYGKFSIDITAPGEHIEGYTSNALTIDQKSGTSQATAIVTGIAAALSKHKSSFDYSEVKCAILSTADHINSLSDKILTCGFVNAKKAFKKYVQGCNHIIDTPICSNTGVGLGGRINQNKKSNYKYKISPNPVDDYINIGFESEVDEIILTLYNINGKLLFSNKFSKTNFESISTKNFDSGLYILRYESPTESGATSIFIK